MHAHRLHPLAAGVLVLALACLAAALTPRPAGAQCSYTPLTSQTPVAVSTSPSFYTINQTAPYWTVVAVQPQSGTDWDISVWQDTYPYPGCVTTLLAGSALGGSAVDFVVGDYNHNAYGTRYVEANRFAGTGNATVEWNATNGQLFINAAFFHVEFAGGAAHFIYIWDVYLYAGTTYTFEFYPYGSAASHLLLFRNATQGTCWKRRVDAEFDVTSGRTYVAPATGYYGVVVVNDNGASGFAEGNVEACTPPIALTSGVSESSSLARNYYSFDQQAYFWTAVGLRNDEYSQLGVYRSNPGSPVPGCFSDELAASSPGATYAGVVVGDFNYNAKGTYYALTSHSVNLPPHMATVQWDDGADGLAVNGAMIHGTMAPSDVVRVWDVWLNAGVTYHFSFSRSGADLKLLLFRNPGAGECWTWRWGSVLSTTTDADYTAPSSGYYGVVIVNDNGANGEYALAVGTCTSPLAMAAGFVYETTLALNYCSFTQTQPYWTAVGVRGASDWDIAAFRSGSGGTFWTCFSDQLAWSNFSPPLVDFFVGDFNFNPSGTYYALPFLYAREGSGMGSVQWDSGADQIQVNGATVSRSTDGSGVLEAWDVSLAAGLTYRIRFNPYGLAGFKLFVFENPGAGQYWAPRSAAVLQATGPVSYTPARGGWHGLVVVNENGQPGFFDLRIDQPVVAVEAERPAVTALRAVGPNPARGTVRLGFDLREPGEVAFEVHDMAGRLVAALPARAWGAGTWSAEWEDRSASGGRLRAGVYFVRMKVDGRVIGTRRFTLLE